MTGLLEDTIHRLRQLPEPMQDSAARDLARADDEIHRRDATPQEDVFRRYGI